MASQDTTLVGACGLFCGTCLIYTATILDIKNLKLQLAKEIFIAENPEGNISKIKCFGCHGNKDLHWSPRCKILRCTTEKNILTCAECSEFACEKLVSFYKHYEEFEGELYNEILEIKKIGIKKWLDKKNIKMEELQREILSRKCR